MTAETFQTSETPEPAPRAPVPTSPPVILPGHPAVRYARMSLRGYAVVIAGLAMVMASFLLPAIMRNLVMWAGCGVLILGAIAAWAWGMQMTTASARERAAGYTTMRNGPVALWLLDAKTGAVLRRAGEVDLVDALAANRIRDAIPPEPPALLPGRSARALSRLVMASWAVSGIGVAWALTAAVRGPQLHVPSLLLAVVVAVFGVAAVAALPVNLWARRRLRARTTRELAAGYTTLPGRAYDHWQLDPKTGAVLRRPGETTARPGARAPR